MANPFGSQSGGVEVPCHAAWVGWAIANRSPRSVETKKPRRDGRGFGILKGKVGKLPTLRELPLRQVAQHVVQHTAMFDVFDLDRGIDPAQAASEVPSLRRITAGTCRADMARG
jgi:hypothetical protein